MLESRRRLPLARVSNMNHLSASYESKVLRQGLDLFGRTIWHVPGCFRIARWLGPSYSLRCVVFHNVADSESAFTRGLGVTITSKDFESALRFLTRYYTPVCLQDVLAVHDGHRLPERPVLVTFDDAYASVLEVAAPMCREYSVPAVYFVNAGVLDNRDLAFDNLVCYAANTMGLEAINQVAGIFAAKPIELRSLKDVFRYFVPALSLATREAFRKVLVKELKNSEYELAVQAGLYLTSPQVEELAAFNFEVGNHTYTHVNCRQVTGEDLNAEIDRNKTELEHLSRQNVRSFSVPYGASEDLSDKLVRHLERTGHKAAFLAEGTPNNPCTGCFSVNRVSISCAGDAALFSKIEMLPRFRAMRRWQSSKVRSGTSW